MIPGYLGFPHGGANNGFWFLVSGFSKGRRASSYRQLRSGN